jgi:lysophospholipase L1-like esterase
MTVPTRLLAIAVVAMAIGCASTPGAEGEVVRFLALGDSYTIGESVPERERWPVQLAAMLRERGVAVDDPVIIARTGWTTDELAAGIEAAQPEGRFDLVSLLIGVNNQYRGRDAEEYRTQFRERLSQAIRFADGDARRVIVLSIPDWGVMPFAEGRDRARIASEIDRFNAINREETSRAGARYVDVTPVSREATGNAALVAGDGLHPAGAQYTRWAELALPAALAALGRGD